ncbi:MAG: protein translocase subunit SecD [Spirochaetota bacterium]|jgi:preprotein translocase subunit SecD|nr:protein translocase subunit SecD [Spirochaetota bacterium]
MKFKFRSSVIIIVLLLCWWGLNDTIEWYFVLPEAEKDLIGLSIEEIDQLPKEQKEKVLFLKDKRRRVLNLGLDLQGGLYLVLGLNDEQFAKYLADKYTEVLQSSTMRGVSARDPEFQTELAKKIAEEKSREQDAAILSAYNRIGNRIDQFGVSEPLVQKGSDNRIYISLAGIKDPQAAEEIVSKAGRLTFQLYDLDTQTRFVRQYRDTRPELLAASDDGRGLVAIDAEIPKDFEMPEGTALYWLWSRDQFDVPQKKGGLFIFNETLMDGRYIREARPSYDQYSSEVHVSFILRDEGVDLFARVTGDNIGKHMAIVLDDKVQSYPVIQGRIPGGSGQITGNFTLEEAKNLAAILSAGSFDVGLKIEEKRSVGPSLGRDSIVAGFQAAVIGFLLIVVFMAIYYKYCGVIADVSLLLNFVIAITVMIQLQSTLTLPGIAGLILMLGMAVDANVLIYERIREELRKGDITLRVAIDRGFGRAFVTILDSNLTTLLAALVMMQLGSGTVKGFAVTLFIGILTSMFTALFVTRYLVDGSVSLFKMKRLPI